MYKQRFQIHETKTDRIERTNREIISRDFTTFISIIDRTRGQNISEFIKDLTLLTILTLGICRTHHLKAIEYIYFEVQIGNSPR